ncbi:MAG TPA: hypothetical protein VN648_30070, partial [Candidatus Methylomirabilis sp.]|nr:hypothetical protein [Candidatus Methylomirabilis sp.]
PDAPKARIDWAKQPPVVPVMPGGLASIQDKVTTILMKVEKLPLDDISRDLKKVLETLDLTLQDVNKMVVRVDGEVVPDVKKTLGTLDQALQNADKMLVRVDGEVVPEVKKTLEDLQKSVTSAQRVLANTDAALLGPDAPAQQDLRDALQEITRAAREFRVLADYLERHPETLIRGKAQEKP